MSKKLLERPEKEKERSREMYQQGDVVFAKHLSLWCNGVYIQKNKDGSLRVRIGRERVDLRPWDVAPRRRNVE